jgi:hypothetical protein
MTAPIYTSHNTSDPAYQLDWSYSIFWHAQPPDTSWLHELKQLNEPDHIRILQHEFRKPNVSQFLISTRPAVPPLLIVQRLKGRLQHLLHGAMSKPLRRNYSLRSIGSTGRETLEQYLANQPSHHPMAEPRVQQRLQQYQVFRPEVDLSQPRRTSHAEYWYNLHIVLVNDARYMEIRHEEFQSLVRRELLVVAVGDDRNPPDQFHHEVRPARLGRAGVQDLGDVRMVHERQSLPLGLEPRDDFPRIHAGLDDLECDPAADGVLLLGDEHEPKSTLTDLLQQLVGADVAARPLGDGLVQRGGCRSGRRIEEAAGIFMKLQQSLDSLAQAFVWSACLIEEGGPFGGLTFQGGSEDCLFVHGGTSQIPCSLLDVGDSPLPINATSGSGVRTDFRDRPG